MRFTSPVFTSHQLIANFHTKITTTFNKLRNENLNNYSSFYLSVACGRNVNIRLIQIKSFITNSTLALLFTSILMAKRTLRGRLFILEGNFGLSWKQVRSFDSNNVYTNL